MKRIRLVPVAISCKLKELVSERGLGDRMCQKTNTGNICHISEHARSDPTE